jgi:hypothetical protein
MLAFGIACGLWAPFTEPAHAQCGVGWTLAAGKGPGSYEICYDEARERTVLFSGTTTYEWDGVSWETVAISGPPDRGAAAMVYDPIGKRSLLFGGYSAGGARKDLWSWNGVTWTQLASAPPEALGRGDFAMAFDRGRNRLVIHGGWPGGGQLLTDTLEWNPTNNSWQRWASSPIGNRYAHRMAYDEARGEIILHGGYYFTNKNDTWRWNGSSWSLAGNSGPARYVFGMTYDSGRQQVILHGGTTCCGEVEYPQTYTWNGTSWSLCPVQGPARGYMNIAFDRQRDVLVLPGGMGPTPNGRAYVPETWELAMSIPPSTLRVPLEYPSIQAAVDAAVAGDTVLVAPGEYVESVNLRGKAILVKSEEVGGAVVLAPEGSRSFVANSNETPNTRVIGFRIGRNGKIGGGAAISAASPVFDSCEFVGCRNETGGGALVEGGGPTFIACDFTRCVATSTCCLTYGGGGAIRNLSGDILVDDCAFVDCTGYQNAHCIMQEDGSIVVRGSVIVSNVQGGFAQTYNAYGSFLLEDTTFDGIDGSSCAFGWDAYTIRRCVFRNATTSSIVDIRFGNTALEDCRVERCAITGGYLFRVTYSGTYSAEDVIVCNSPGQPFQGPWTDLGGNDFNASCSCFGDINGDGMVDGFDLGVVLSGWQNGPGSNEGDLSGDGETDAVDLALILVNWGPCP